jgi:hypothetical protein
MIGPMTEENQSGGTAVAAGAMLATAREQYERRDLDGRALSEFLGTHPQEYLVDRKYCDFFGTNVTWCVNGFLKRVKPKPLA